MTGRGDRPVAPTRRPTPALRGMATLAAITVLLLVAFALRYHRLGAQSLDNDEILSLEAATVPLVESFSKAALVDHPPLYYLLLRLWVGLMGQDEMVVRLPTLAFGLLALAVLFTVARRLARGRRSGLALAALALGAAAPLLVYYDQEARMYSLAALGCLLAFSGALRATAGQPWGWPLWTGATTLALFSDYTTMPALLAAEVPLLAGLVGATGRSPLQRWLVNHGVVAALFLPWFLLARQLAGIYGGAAGDSTPLGVVANTAQAFAVGASLAGPWAATAAVVGVAAAAAGLALGPFSPAARLGLAAYLAFPVATSAVLAGSGLGFAPRHVLVALPAYVVAIGALTAAPVSGLWHPLRTSLAGAVVAGLLLLQGWSLANYYRDPWLGRPDFRAAAAYLRQQVAPEDLVIFNAPWARAPFSHYWPDMPRSIGGPRSPPRPDEVEAALAPYVQTEQRLWLVRWQDWITDPQGVVPAWLDQRAVPREMRAFTYVTVHSYMGGAYASPVRPAVERETDVRFGEVARLVGYDVRERPAEEGARVDLTLYWQTLGRSERGLKVFVHLVSGPPYTPWGQRDNAPVYGRYPTDEWETGLYVRDEYRIEALPAAPPGPYSLAVGLYDPVSGTRVTTSEGEDRALLGPVTVRPWRASSRP